MTSSNGRKVRVGLRFDIAPPSCPSSKHFMLLIDRDAVRCVSDVEHTIAFKFGFSSSRFLVLSIHDFVLLSSDEVDVIRDGDEIQVKLDHGVIEPENQDSLKSYTEKSTISKRKRRKTEDNSCKSAKKMKNIKVANPSYPTSTIKKKKKLTKKKSSLSRKKMKMPKTCQKSSSIQPIIKTRQSKLKTPSVQSCEASISSDKSDNDQTGNVQQKTLVPVMMALPSAVKSSSSSESSDSSSDSDDQVLLPTESVVVPLQAKVLKKLSPAKLGLIKNDTSSSDSSSSTDGETSKEKDTIIAKQPLLPKHPPKLPELSSSSDDSSSDGGKVVKSVSKDPPEHNLTVIPNLKNKVSVSSKVPHQKSNINVCTTQNESSSTNSSSDSDSSVPVQKNEPENRDKYFAQLAYPNYHNRSIVLTCPQEKNVPSENSQENSKISESKAKPLVDDYNSLLSLSWPPRTGDKIAYQVLELSPTDYTPHMSAFKEVEVVHVNPNKQITVKILYEEKQSENLSKPGRFELLYDDQPEDMESDKEINDTSTLIWSSLVNVKLIQ